MQATQRYLAGRGFEFDTAPADTPLLASLMEPNEVPSYPALYQSFKAFVHDALEHSGLHPHQRSAARGAALRWLRHSHATRAAERGVPLGVLQEGLGHADPRRTATYYRTQTEQRQQAMEGAFAAAGAPE
jgi:integrase